MHLVILEIMALMCLVLAGDNSPVRILHVSYLYLIAFLFFVISKVLAKL